MKALVWHGKHDVRVEQVPDPTILNPRDAIVNITATAICGSDLHLYDGFIPTHEGRATSSATSSWAKWSRSARKSRICARGDRVVVPFTIACGHCFFCEQQLWSACDNSNPNAWMAEKLYGYSAAGLVRLLAHVRRLRGRAGGICPRALRRCRADQGPRRAADEQVLFLSDIFPTGYMAAENCNIQPGDTVAVWGCGPVGQFAIKSAYMLGAERVIAIDRFPERLAMARDKCGAETINYEDEDVIDTLKEMTGGRGPDACIDAVGMEAHGTQLDAIYDKAKQLVRAGDRPPQRAARRRSRPAARAAPSRCPASTAASSTRFPFGAAFAKGLTFKMGQTHVHALSAAAAGPHRAGRDRPDVSSSPTGCRSTTRRTATRYSRRRTTSASRSS